MTGRGRSRREAPLVIDSARVPDNRGLCLHNLCVWGVCGFLAAWGVGVYLVLWPGTKPSIDEKRWWGKTDPPEKLDTSIRAYQVHFTDEMVTDLKYRLKNRIPLTPPLQGVKAEYGINTNYLNRVLDYWHDDYDFKRREAYLNSFPRFKTNIQGLDISFVRIKPKIPKHSQLRVVPLMLLHGWPSSSQEFLKVVPYLTSPIGNRGYVFEVIAPDLPGFGFSEGSTRPGMNSLQTSILMRNLMRRLGFTRYCLQGGDWGSHVAANLAVLFPDEVLGLHQNLPHSDMTITYIKILVGALFPKLSMGAYADRLYPLNKYFKYLLKETGYFHIQATKPDTIGVGLSDSPSGLAGYVLEKVGSVTRRDWLHDEDGGIGNSYAPEDLLDMLTIVWANRCITQSMRFYAESAGPMHEADARALLSLPIPVPTAIVNFKHEIFYLADWMLSDRYVHLVRSVTLDYGGHFPGLEHPEVLAKELWEATEAFIKYQTKVGVL